MCFTMYKKTQHILYNATTYIRLAIYNGSVLYVTIMPLLPPMLLTCDKEVGILYLTD